MSAHITFANSPVCHLLKCRYPVLLAGMGGVARHELVAAVINAGGFGFLGMVRESPALISQEIALVREKTDREFGVNLIPASTDQELLEAEVSVCLKEKVFSVGLFWDLSEKLVKRLTDHGILVVCQVGTVAEAVAAQDAGAGIIVAQGVEAGGHVRGRSALRKLILDMRSNVDVPIVAAGGIGNGHDIVDVFAGGAQGVMLGTVFIATQESFAHTYHKQRLLNANATDPVLTTDFHINWPRQAAVRVLRNSVTNGDHGSPDALPHKVIGDKEGRPIYLFSTDSPLRSMTGDFESMALYAGESVQHVAKIVSAADRLNSLIREVSALTGEDGIEVASPPCFAGEVDKTYMGF